MKKKIILSSLTLAGLGWLAISDYFFKYAMTTYKKKPESKELSGRDALYRDKLGFKEFEKQEWILRVDSNISLYANYLDNHSKKTTILLHGFMSDGDSMAGFARCFMIWDIMSCCLMRGHMDAAQANILAMAG